MWALQDVTLELYYFPYTQNVELERKLTSLSRADDAPPQRDALLQQLKYELQQKDSLLTDLRDQLDDQVRRLIASLSHVDIFCRPVQNLSGQRSAKS